MGPIKSELDKIELSMSVLLQSCDPSSVMSLRQRYVFGRCISWDWSVKLCILIGCGVLSVVAAICCKEKFP